MINYNVIEGENYWNKYEDFLKLYNDSPLNTKEIREYLQITSNKYQQYREREIEESRLKKRGEHRNGRRRN